MQDWSALEASVVAQGYRLHDLLGERPNSRVYRASDAQGETVAVKLLGATEEALRARFAREGKLATRLRHPHLAQARELVSVPEGAFLVMELVAGGSLQARLEQGPLTEQDSLTLLDQVGGALAYAHGEGVVHRDVKPSNVLIGDVRQGFLLCDLGLARDLDSSTSLTESGTWVGTCMYFSPEQVEGLPAEPPVDVFALGATAFHALTGTLPFPARSVLELARKIRFGQPLDPRRIRPELSRGTCELLTTLFEKDPSDRPTAAEVSERARSLLGGGR